MSAQAKLYISMGIIALIAIISFAIIFFGVYQVYYAPATLFSRDFEQAEAVEAVFDQRVINVLVLGLHNRNDDNSFGEIYFVDTIIIASINFDCNAMTLLAVPRDAYVPIAGSEETDRIRQSYSYGYRQAEVAGEDRHGQGMVTTLETVSALLEGVELHYHIAMDVQGLKQLIDSLGGVYYDVEQTLIGHTPLESLEAGPQLLDGQGYLTYLTYREPDARDDLNRMKRQKALLLATFDYFQQMGLFRYVIPTYATYREHIETDLSFNQIAALTLFAAERLESDAISDYSLQGRYFTLVGEETYYLELDQEMLQECRDLLSGGRGY